MDNTNPIPTEPTILETPPNVETGVIQPELIGVEAPEGYTGPWPKPDQDGGDPSSWV